MKLVTVVTLAVSACLAIGYNTSNANEKGEVKLRYARICDPSGCYLAWNVVDSDGDGASDADELLAGTDPFDWFSRPSLRIVAELAGKELLPSFEAGQGVFFVYSVELQAVVKKSKSNNDPFASFPFAPKRDSVLTAFPLHAKQGTTLSRLGISATQLKEHGIDLDRDSFTVGLVHTSKEGGMPERRIGGVKVGLISADSAEDDPTPLPDVAHGAKTKDEMLDGDHFVTYADGSVKVDWSDGGGMLMDKDGYVLNIWYVNPDADQGTAVTAPTPEQIKAFERLRGATIRTVEGWSAPGVDEKLPRDKQDTIILLDPEYAYNPAIIFDAPRVTTAQPEYDPNLPRVDVPAGSPGGAKSDCTYGCKN